MDTITNQEIIYKVILHAAKQKIRSAVYEPHMMCRYRLNFLAQCTIRCFIGIFICDDKYDHLFEGCIIQKLPLNCFMYNFTNEQIGLLRKLQYVHDEYLPIDWATQLEKFLISSNSIWCGHPPEIIEALEILHSL